MLDVKHDNHDSTELSKDGKIKVSLSQIKDIFINMEQILKFHQILFHELETVAKNWTVHSRVGQMFCKQAPFMKVSVEYFQKKEKASKLLKELLKSDQKFKQIVDDISQQDEVNHEPLEQFLNRPVKRISEYNLLLQKMNESMFDWQPDSKHVHIASQMMEEIASFFNFCIHRKANMEKVLDIEQQIISYNPISLMLKLAEEATQIELAKKQGLKIDKYEIIKIRLQWQKYFHRIRLVRPSRCFVSDIEEKQKQLYLMNAIEGRFLFFLFTPTNTYLFDAMNSEARRRFITKLEGYVKKQDENIQKKVEATFNPRSSISNIQQIQEQPLQRQIKNNPLLQKIINKQEYQQRQLVKHQSKQVQNKQQKENIENQQKEQKPILKSQIVKKMFKVKMMVKKKKKVLKSQINKDNDNKQKSIDLQNIELKEQEMLEFNQQKQIKMKKDIEIVNNLQNDQQLGDDQYEEIEYEEEEEIEQEIEQDELVPITETSPIQDENQKEIDKDKEEDNLDDLGIPPRNCVSPSLVNPFHPPIKPVLWARLLNDWQIDQEIQIQQDQPRPEEYIPLLKQDSGSKYYNIQQEPDKIQEKIDELNNKKKEKTKKEKEYQTLLDKQSSQQKPIKQQSNLVTSPQQTKLQQPNVAADKNDQEKLNEEEELLDPEVFKMRIKRGTIPSFQEFEEMRRKLAEQSSYLKGYSAKGRQQRMKSGYKVLGLAVDDAEKNSVPVAPQILPRNHPFMLHGPPRKWYQKQINKMIYTKSQIADILATRELKSIFDTVWFQEYTEEFKKKNNRNIAKLTWHQIYEAQIPDHIIELPELTKQEKKSTLRFGYVDSDSDYADDSDSEDDDEDEDDDDDDEESEFNIEDVMGSNLFDFKIKRKKNQKKEKE
ncbi:MAG: hypothetical protein EZS28_025401, partial [Streblomastix strix]